MNSCCLVLFLALLFVGYLIYKQNYSHESYHASGLCSNTYSENNFGEYNESCYLNPFSHCVLSDNSAGNCVSNGICLPKFLSS